MILEVFVNSEQQKLGFGHICISVKNRESLAEKSVQCAYNCIRIKRNTKDLIFIKDNCGNQFELKELNPKH